ncbi:MAG: response regulator [Pyrinomonadaceae bacterium]
MKQIDSYTILVVNDSTDQLDLMQFLLEQEGYKILTAMNGAQGLEIAARKYPDLIISDVRMPVMNGIEMCRQIREIKGLSVVPLMLVSALELDNKIAVEGLQAGADDYLKIPFEYTQLVAKVARLLERRNAQWLLEHSETYYRALIENASDLVSIINADGIMRYQSPSLERILGYETEDLAGGNIFEFLHPDDVEEARRAFQEVLEQPHKLVKLEVRFRNKNGEWRHFICTLTNLLDNAVIAGIVANAVDITERKQAEEAQRESEERYRILFDNNPIPMWVYDAETLEFLAVNKAAIFHYGYSKEEFLSMTILDIRPPEDVPAVMENLSNLQKGFDITDIWKHRIKDGSIIEVEISSHDLIFDGKRSRLVLANDITERRRAEEALRKSEEQLQQSQKLESIGRLAGGIAHDFNNLLTAINGYSELTLRELDFDDPLRRNIEEIKKAGDRAASLTRQLLAFSRKQVLKPKILDINAIILDVEKMLRRLIGEDVELRTVIQSRLGKIKADPGQIEQVLMNLAVNARDAMPKGGTLTVEASNVYLDDAYARGHIGVKPGSYVMLAVSDNGTGIDSETLQHIFEPFFTTKETGKGTGLGLAMIYGIVKQSGGNIWVYSELGKGTTFKIYLPRVEASDTVVEQEDIATDLQQGTETILLVEDEDMVRNLSRQILESCGYKVIEAENGIEALVVCENRENKIDLLVTDVVMPQMGGRELSERLARKYPHIKVLFTSGYTDDAIVRHGIIDAGTNFLQKPFTLDALSRKVRELLDAPKV